MRASIVLVANTIIASSMLGQAPARTFTPTPTSRVRSTKATRFDALLPHVIQAGRVAVVANADVSRIRPGEFIARKTGDSVRVEIRKRDPGMVTAGRSQDTITLLPYLFEGKTNENRKVRLRPAIIKEEMRYQRDERMFRGTLLIALEDVDASTEERPLWGPIRINVATQGDQVDPSQLDVLQTNTLSSVNVVARDPQDSVRTQVVPTFDLRGIDVWLPVRPTILMPNPRKSAAGLGVSTVPLTVTVRGRALKDSVRVLVTTDRGSVEPYEVVIPPAGIGRVQLRTEGIGRATISASSGGLDSAEIGIDFDWPIVFLLAALAGGAIGGVAVQLRRKRRAHTGLLRPAIVGAVIGFVAAIVYRALGINLISIAIHSTSSDEASVFAFALLAGALGIPALANTKAASRLFPRGNHD